RHRRRPPAPGRLPLRPRLHRRRRRCDLPRQLATLLRPRAAGLIPSPNGQRTTDKRPYPPSMRQPGAEVAVDPGAGDGADEADDHDAQAAADEGVDGPRAGTQQRPADAEHDAAKGLAVPRSNSFGSTTMGAPYTSRSPSR